MPTRQGREQEHLEVTTAERLTIQGSVEAGATLRTGARLVIQGAATGPLLLESDAVLDVQGALNISDPAESRGLILVAGVINGNFRHLLEPDGRLAVAAGTLLHDEGGYPSQVQADGSLVELRQRNNDVSVDASVLVGYLSSEDRWVNLDQLGTADSEH